MQSEQSEIKTQRDKNSALAQVEAKIRESDSILIALSQNPTIDELATAVGLGMFIDKMGKHATVIYSGQTPNAIAFLKPEQQIETNTNSLQDFIIAINKEKADHLRYKLDGDYVKVYITPYRTTITENDLEFSHGDYNVDLVIALNVENSAQLDQALSEHGRIMHDATIIDIAAGVPGKFGDIQWSDPTASSVAEMVTGLILNMKDDAEVDSETATAILTGIVAATGRFSNERTTPETMKIASQLMSLGADQQLISANIGKEQTLAEPIPEPIPEPTAEPSAPTAEPADPSFLAISREEPAVPLAPEPAVTPPQSTAEPQSLSVAPEPTPANIVSEMSPAPVAAEEPSTAPIIEVPEMSPTPVAMAEPQAAPTPVASNEPSVAEPQLPPASEPIPPAATVAATEPILPPVTPDFKNEENLEMETTPASFGVIDKDYGQMMDEELKKDNTNRSGYVGNNPALMAAPDVMDGLEENHLPELNFDRPVDMSDTNSTQAAGSEDSFLASSPMKTLDPEGDVPTPTPVVTTESPVNPTPVVAAPEITPASENVGQAATPEESPLPMPDFNLAPPPTPPAFSTDALPPVQEPTPVNMTPEAPLVSEQQPAAEPAMPLVHPELQALEDAKPAANEFQLPPVPESQPATNQPAQPTSDPGAFKIPGM